MSSSATCSVVMFLTCICCGIQSIKPFVITEILFFLNGQQTGIGFASWLSDVNVVPITPLSKEASKHNSAISLWSSRSEIHPSRRKKICYDICKYFARISNEPFLRSNCFVQILYLGCITAAVCNFLFFFFFSF